MNPNRKEGRFHWCIERLEITGDGSGGRKLRLANEASDEKPELPRYEPNRKIPTGRMDLKERQRLRESMDLLNVKRKENVGRKRAQAKDRFLKRLFKMKEEFEKKELEVKAKIEEERCDRVAFKEEMMKAEIEEKKR